MHVNFFKPRNSVFLIAITAAWIQSCKTGNSTDASESKDVESVTRLNWVVASLPTGAQIAVIKCSKGWVDASSGGQSEFAVPYQEVNGLSTEQLNKRYCLTPVAINNTTPANGGSVVSLGYYRKTSQGAGCKILYITPKTQNGHLRALAVTCAPTNTLSDYFC